MKLTKTACKDLVASNAGRSVHWDDDLSGFGARLNANKTLSFVLKYRVKGDPKQRFATLGDWPTVHPDVAREEARRIREGARLGRDALSERATNRATSLRASTPLEPLLTSWLAATEARAVGKEGKGQSARYERELIRVAEKSLRPLLKGVTVSGFNPRQFQALLVKEGSANLRGAIVRFIAHASAELMLQGIEVDWPTRFTIPKASSGPRTNRYTMGQMAALWKAAGALGRRGALVRLMMLTGCRRGEAQRVQWGHLHLEDSLKGPHWRQPGSLTKNGKEHLVPLSKPAVKLLRWLPPKGDNPLVFPGARVKKENGGLIGGWTDIRNALRSLADVDIGTLHDFRRTMVSELGDNGFDPQVADSLLNHSASNTMGGVMAVYQRSELWDRRREAVDLWTKLLMKKVGKDTSLDRPFEEVKIRRSEA